MYYLSDILHPYQNIKPLSYWLTLLYSYTTTCMVVEYPPYLLENSALLSFLTPSLYTAVMVTVYLDDR